MATWQMIEMLHCTNKCGIIYTTYIYDCRPEYDTQSGQDDLVRLTVTLAEEFLNLLITIISK